MTVITVIPIRTKTLHNVHISFLRPFYVFSDNLKPYNYTFQLNFSPATGNLLGLLAENGRLNKLDTVINAFKIMMAAHRGEVTCEVITAKPLDQAQRQSLEAALKV